MPTSDEDDQISQLTSKQRELGKLYPTPKTFDQLAQDRKENAKRHALRAPKHVFLTTSLKMYSAVACLLLVVTTLPYLISTGAISGVFLSFLLGLIVYAYVLWVTSSISRMFEKITLNATPLFLFYLFFYPTPAYLLYMQIDHLPMIVWLLALTSLHFIIVYILFKVIEKYTQRD